MKKALLIVSIVVIVACLLSFLLGLINMQAYHSLRDGSSEHYNRLHQRIIIYFVAGIVLAVIGMACIIFRFKL